MTLEELRERHRRWTIRERGGRLIATTRHWVTQTARTRQLLDKRLTRIDPILARPAGLT